MSEITRAKRRAWALVAAWVAAIVLASSIPHPPTAPVSIIPVDKLVHFTEYFGFGALLLRATLVSNWKRAPLWTLVITICFAILDEAHQYFVPSRVPDVADALADCTGALLGTLCFFVFSQRTQAEKLSP